MFLIRGSGLILKDHVVELLGWKSSGFESGAKHSPPGGKFQKSGDHRATGGDTPFDQVSDGQIISK